MTETDNHLPQTPNEVLRELQKSLQRQMQWKNSFGLIKPIIHTTHNGQKFVAVGNTLLYSNKWKTFPDFLFEYIWHVFGKKWLDAQLQKPLADQHVAIQWHRSFSEFTSRQKRLPDGTFQAHPNGAMSALLLLSYDLYTVSHNVYLHPTLVERLRKNDQFQGARYELFAISALLRAGFSICYEDETDRTRTHPELIATHLRTGESIAVEAKSKHRHGVLATKGQPFDPDDVRLGKITKLINNAVSKDVTLPLVVFVDLNLPPDVAEAHLGGKPTQSTIKVFDSIKQEAGSVDLFNLILFTNHPHHYGRDDKPDPKRMYSALLSRKPKRKVANQILFDDILKGVLQYGTVPQTFESQP